MNQPHWFLPTPQGLVKCDHLQAPEIPTYQV